MITYTPDSSTALNIFLIITLGGIPMVIVLSALFLGVMSKWGILK